MGGDDAAWMDRALRLASLSLGMTWPNPGVGCVLVRAGRLLGQGRHRRCGDLHAETAALADCRARGHDPAGATAYVTLAPCTRQGRQPPCTSALIAARVARVVAAVGDPAQDAAAPLLGAAGIAYEVGCRGERARHLHGGFLARVASGRPRITGKWAMTLDGCIATSRGDAGWISAPLALALSRRRRRAYDAILVGAGTVRADDPQLLATRPADHGGEPGPLRVVVSAGAGLEPGSRLVATLARAPLLVVHAPTAPVARLTALTAAGVRLLAVDDPHDPAQVALALGRLGLNELLVEGGAALHGAWLRAGMYDRLEIYVAPLVLGGGLPAAAGPGMARVADGQGYEAEEPPRALGPTWCLRLRRRHPFPASAPCSTGCG